MLTKLVKVLYIAALIGLLFTGCGGNSNSLDPNQQLSSVSSDSLTIDDLYLIRDSIVALQSQVGVNGEVDSETVKKIEDLLDLFDKTSNTFVNEVEQLLDSATKDLELLKQESASPEAILNAEQTVEDLKAELEKLNEKLSDIQEEITFTLSSSSALSFSGSTSSQSQNIHFSSSSFVNASSSVSHDSGNAHSGSSSYEQHNSSINTLSSAESSSSIEIIPIGFADSSGILRFSIQEDDTLSQSLDTIWAKGTNKDSLQWRVIGGDVSGSLVFFSGKGEFGALKFTPAQNFNGTGSFLVMITDGIDSDTCEVIYQVTPVNDAPNISNGDTLLVQMASFLPAVLIYATDVDSDISQLRWNILSGQAQFETANNIGSSIRVVYDKKSIGFDTTVVEVKDDGNSPGADTVVIIFDLSKANSAPRFSKSNVLNVYANSGDVTDIPLSAIDDEFDSISWSLKTAPLHGIIDVSGIGENRVFKFYAESMFDGNDSIGIEITDSRGLSNSTIVYVRITKVNEKPRYDSIPKLNGPFNVGTTISIDTVSECFDPEGTGVFDYSWFISDDSTTFTQLSDTTSTLTLTSRKFWKHYVKAVVTCSDGTSNPSVSKTTAISSIITSHGNSKPILNDVKGDVVELSAEESLILTFSPNDYDIDGDSISYRLLSTSSNGEYTVRGDSLLVKDSYLFLCEKWHNTLDTLIIEGSDGIEFSNLNAVISCSDKPHTTIPIHTFDIADSTAALLPNDNKVSVENADEYAYKPEYYYWWMEHAKDTSFITIEVDSLTGMYSLSLEISQDDAEEDWFEVQAYNKVTSTWGPHVNIGQILGNDLHNDLSNGNIGEMIIPLQWMGVPAKDVGKLRLYHIPGYGDSQARLFNLKARSY